MASLLRRAFIGLSLIGEQCTFGAMSLLTHPVSTGLGHPLIDIPSIFKRDLKSDVCGAAGTRGVASDDRNGDTWNNNKIGQWFIDESDSSHL